MHPPFIVDYQSAWREGVICRGMDISDKDAKEGSKLNNAMKHDVLYSGNPTLIKIFAQIPEEAMQALEQFLKSMLVSHKKFNTNLEGDKMSENIEKCKYVPIWIPKAFIDFTGIRGA